MPADERPRDTPEQSATNDPATEPESEKKERSGLQIAAAGLAGAAVVGTGAGAAVVGAGKVVDRLTASESDEADAVAEATDGTDGETAETGSLDVFEDVDIAVQTATETTDEVDTGAADSGPRVTTVSAPRADGSSDAPGTTYDGLGDDPRRVGPRGDSSTPTAPSSAAADATVIAATETGATGVTGAPSPLPTAPLINRPAPDITSQAPAQPAAPPPPPPAPSQVGFDAGSAQQPAAPPAAPAPAPVDPASPAAASTSESTQSAQSSSSSDSSQSSGSNGLDVMDDVAPTPAETASSASDTEEIIPAGPAGVPNDSGIGSTTGADSSPPSSGSGSGSDTGQTSPGYGTPPPYQANPPAQQVDPGYGQQHPPYTGKPPVKDDNDDVKDDDHQNVAPPPYYDDDPYVDPVVDDYVDDVVEDPVYDPYYDPFPGNKGYGHPQDLYGDPQPPGPNQAAKVYVYRGEQGQDYATIIRNENGNETITWWYGDPPDGHVVYEVYVVHDGNGNYTEQITSYPLGEVDAVLGSIYPDGEFRSDPDLDPGKQYADETITPQVIIRSWTDDDGNMTVKRIHRDGSGKIEITYADGVHVVFEDGAYTYYDSDGLQIGGDDLGAAPGGEEPGMQPDENDPGADFDAGEPITDGVHPLAGGPDYFIEEQYVNPFTAGFNPIGQGDHVQYVDPTTGANIFVTNIGGGVYLVGWRTDPDTPPGSWDLLIKISTDANGNYASYNPTHYTGDVPVENIGPLGYVSVDGELYQDPWNTYGFPADNASQVVTEETVTQTWEVDGGAITKTFYRDGSFKTVIEYPDGVVITYDPAENGGLPSYETPGGVQDVPESYEGVEGAFLPPTAPDVIEYNGQTYPNPEADDSFTYLKTEGPFGYPGGSMVQHTYVGEDGYLVIISVHSDGQYELMYGDPATPMAGWDMRIVMQADGSYTPIDQYLVDDAPADEPVASPSALLLSNAPDEFEHDGVTYPNPETDDDFQHVLSTPDGSHYYSNSDGYTVLVIDTGNGSYNIFWGNPNANNGEWDLGLATQANGSYAPLPEFAVDDVSTGGEESPTTAAEPRTYYSSDYVHPEDQYPDGPQDIQWSGDNRVDIYPAAQVWTRLEDGTQEIYWMAVGDDGSILTTKPPISTPGAPTLIGGSEPPAVPVHAMHISVLADGSHIVRTLPPEAWRVVPHWMGNDGEYRDPDLSGMSYAETFRGIDGSANLYREYEDGTIKQMARDDGTLYIHYPDGAVIQVDPGGDTTVLLTAEGVLYDDDVPSNGDPSLDPDALMDSAGDDEGDQEDAAATSGRFVGDLNPINPVDLPNLDFGSFSVPSGTPDASDPDGLELPDAPDDGTTTGTLSVASEEPAQEDSFEWWAAHLPATWTVNGQTLINPESPQGIDSGYTLVRDTDSHRVYESDGDFVRITQLRDGGVSFEWGTNVSNPDIIMSVYADGTSTVTYNAADAPPLIDKTETTPPVDKTAAPEESEAGEPLEFEKAAGSAVKDLNLDRTVETVPAGLFSTEEPPAQPESTIPSEVLVPKEALQVEPLEQPQIEIPQQDFSMPSLEVIETSEELEQWTTRLEQPETEDDDDGGTGF
jgi:hypothetical protein